MRIRRHRRKYHSGVDLPSFPEGTDIVIDATNPAYVTDDGTNVSQILDISGNDNNVTASGTERPTLGGTPVNGLQSLVFNGSSNVMRSDFDLPQVGSDDLYVLLALYAQVGTSNRVFAACSQDTAAGVTRGGPWKWTQRSSIDLRIPVTDAFNAADTDRWDGAYTSPNPYVWGMTIERLTSTSYRQEIYSNSTSVGDSVARSGDGKGPLNLTDRLTIGGDKTALFQRMDFCEIRVASGPNVRDNFIAQLEGMLTKYNV